jgi:hypothetical protein
MLRLTRPNDVIAVNERHLKRLVNEYIGYCHGDRPRLALEKGIPAAREAATKLGVDPGIIAAPRLDGLHHCCDLTA